jgi:hypothetical protein
MRTLPAADPERMDLDARLRRRDGRAHLEHVRTQDEVVPRLQMVGVVLHERRPAGQPVRRRLEGVTQHGRLPVALAAEPDALGHESLHRQSGQLPESAEVFERRRERPVPAVDHEPAQRQLDLRAVLQRLARAPPGRSSGATS